MKEFENLNLFDLLEIYEESITKCDIQSQRKIHEIITKNFTETPASKSRRALKKLALEAESEWIRESQKLNILLAFHLVDEIDIEDPSSIPVLVDHINSVFKKFDIPFFVTESAKPPNIDLILKEEEKYVERGKNNVKSFVSKIKKSLDQIT